MKETTKLICTLTATLCLAANSQVNGYDIPLDMQSPEALELQRQNNEQEIQDLEEEIEAMEDANSYLHGFGEEPAYPLVEDESGFIEPSLDTTESSEDYATGNEVLEYIEEAENLPPEELIEELEEAIQELEEENAAIDDLLIEQGVGLQ